MYVGRVMHVISLKSSDLRSPIREKALMISGSHEICTACRSRLPRFASSSPPFLLSTVPSSYLFPSPPFIVELLPFSSLSSVLLSPFAQKPPRLSPSITLISISPYLLFFALHHSHFFLKHIKNVHSENHINTTNIP